MYQLAIISDMHSSTSQCGVVIGGECRKVFRIAFSSTITTIQLAIHIYSHLWHNCIAIVVIRTCNLYSGQQVLFSIRSQYTHRQLTTRKHHRFAQVFEHKTKRRSRIRHGVCTVQNNKTVVFIIMLLYHLRHLPPTIGI